MWIAPREVPATACQTPVAGEKQSRAVTLPWCWVICAPPHAIEKHDDG
jgi:hypothetical protein